MPEEKGFMAEQGHKAEKVRVCVRRATYDNIAELLPGMMESLDLRGWFEGLRGKTVFLKPNMIGIFPPERHATTHPALVAGLVRLFSDAGARVTVGDNCGVGGYGLNGKVGMITGIADAAGGCYRNVGRDILHVPLESQFAEMLPVSREMMEADVLVSVPKMKTHSLTLVTGAVKNMFGLVAGRGKAQAHAAAPRGRDFGRLLADIFALRVPDLSVMDGIVGMEGNGPTSGRPIAAGAVLASIDAVALDAVMCRIMGVAAHRVHHLREAAGLGLGILDMGRIELLGDHIGRVKFRLPAASRLGGFGARFLYPLAFRWLSRSRLVLDEKLCRRCGICVEGCPSGALSMEDYPLIDEDKCIDCLCCDELCPENAWRLKGLVGLMQRRNR